MRLTRQRLNRTLLLRQHLLERVPWSADDMVRHLVGLQAQERLPPYLSLAARIVDLDPYDVSRSLEEGALVRLLSLRGTIHLLTSDDALGLRGWTAPVHEREIKASQSIGDARQVDREDFLAALSALLADGPLPQKDIGLALAERFTDHRPTELGQLARSAAPLAQLPPRGTWRGAGTVVYQYVDRWLGRPPAAADPEEMIRRYLRAFGPATVADLTTWSGVTRLTPIVKAMSDLVRHEDPDGKVLFDLPDGPIADEDVPAPVRLLGTYDNVWLSHAARDRVTDPDGRKLWMHVNGARGNTIFVDGWLTGLWRIADDRVEVTDLLRDLTAAERGELDDEIARVEALLTR